MVQGPAVLAAALPEPCLGHGQQLGSNWQPCTFRADIFSLNWLHFILSVCLNEHFHEKAL